MKNDNDILMYFDGLTNDILTDSDGLTNFTKQISEKLNEAFVKTLEEYGFHKDYLEMNNSKFSIRVWPHVNVNFGTGEQFRSTQYDVCYCKETLFTVYIIVKSYLDIDGFHSEIILDVRKRKELPFSENITEEEMSN